MVQFNFIYSPGMSLEQMIGFEMAGVMWGQYLDDDVTLNIAVQNSNSLQENVIGGAVPILHEQLYGLFLEYLANDITSEDDLIALQNLQEGNTVDIMIDGELVRSQ